MPARENPARRLTLSALDSSRSLKVTSIYPQAPRGAMERMDRYRLSVRSPSPKIRHY